ncbi:MAG: hypothetical protein FWE54_04990, partial [Methanimicrococcus sp.]|nr:hypothetical protein [Methanimicrococcus sp.]
KIASFIVDEDNGLLKVYLDEDQNDTVTIDIEYYLAATSTHLSAYDTALTNIWAGYEVVSSDAPAPAGYVLNATPYDPILPKIASFIVAEDNSLLKVYLDVNSSDTVTIDVEYHLVGATPSHLTNYDEILTVWAGYEVTTTDAPAPAGYVLNATPYDPVLPKIASFIVDEDNGLLKVYLDENLNDVVTINIEYYLEDTIPIHLNTYDTSLTDIWAGYEVLPSDAPAPPGYDLSAVPYDPILPKIASFIVAEDNGLLKVYLDVNLSDTVTINVEYYLAGATPTPLSAHNTALANIWAAYEVTTSDAPAPSGYILNSTPYDPVLPKIASFILSENNGILMVYLDSDGTTQPGTGNGTGNATIVNPGRETPQVEPPQIEPPEQTPSNPGQTVREPEIPKDDEDPAAAFVLMFFIAVSIFIFTWKRREENSN